MWVFISQTAVLGVICCAEAACWIVDLLVDYRGYLYASEHHERTRP